jgi:hypothetical protein
MPDEVIPNNNQKSFFFIMLFRHAFIFGLREIAGTCGE